MDKFTKKLPDPTAPIYLEMLKEILIKHRPLKYMESEEVLKRTLDLCSQGKYEPDPELVQYVYGDWFYRYDPKDREACFKRFMELMDRYERLRKKFLQERELAESEKKGGKSK